MDHRTTEDDVGPIPPPSARQVDRVRLLDRLDGVATRPLTVVTGPMGSGKTNLVARWCTQRSPLPVTWLVADDEVERAVGEAVGDEPRVVVIDDVRTDAEAEQIAGLVRTLRPGGSLHLVLITRGPLTAVLGEWRLDPSFDQLREADLCITPDELGQLVRAHRGTRPERSVGAAVCEAIDGWFAAGVLIAASWEDRATKPNFRNVLVHGFDAATALAVTATLAGSGPEAGDLLRRTAELPELTSSLCDEIAGGEDSHLVLRALRGNGALLATRRSDPGFVRLHPLARAGLANQATLSAGQRRKVLEVAATWYEEHQQIALAAVCHTELGDWAAATELIVDHLHDLEKQGRIPELAEVFTAFPVTWMRQNFRLLFLSTWMLYVNGDITGALALVALASQGATPEQQVIAEFLRSIPASLVSDPRPCLDAAERGLALCAEIGPDGVFEDLIGTSRTSHWQALCRGAALLSGAYLGEWERTAPLDVPLDAAVAVELRPGAMAALRGRRSAHAAFTGALTIAEQEANTLAAALPPDDMQAAQEGMQAAWAMAEVHRGRARFDAVTELLDIAAYRARVVVRMNNHNLLAAVAASRAALQLDLHQPQAALDILATHRADTGHQPPPHVAGLIAAAEGQALAATGDWDRARHVLTRATRTAAVASALVLTSLDRADLATAGAVVAAWPEDPSIRSRLGHQLALAAISERRGARQEALRHLPAALAIAAPPEGLVEPVLQMGVHLLGPLWHLAQSSVEPGVAALAEQAAMLLRSTGRAHPPLTARERLVLHHLATGATLPSIAEQLTVSVNTVKSQVKSIYRKLAAANRDEALATWRLLQAEPAS